MKLFFFAFQGDVLRRTLLGLFFLTTITLTAQTPVISSFSPTHGPVGTAVTILGTNFSATPENNIVFFGAVRAAVTNASPMQLIVSVPAGTTYQPITVLVNGLTAYSGSFFAVTFPGGGSIYSKSFAAKTDFPDSEVPLDVAIADLDLDGKPDMAVMNLGDNSIGLYKNISTPGSITSASFDAPVSLANDDRGNAIVIGDVDGDGMPDIIVSTYYTNRISIYRNRSAAGVIDANSFAPKVDFDAGTNFNPFGIALGDLDGDGKPELAVANANKTWISVFRNTSTQGIVDAGSFAPLVTFGTGTSPFDVTIGDVDQDGKPDVISINESCKSFSVLKNTSSTGTISFDNAVEFKTFENSQSMILADLDGDMKPDLASANFSDGKISVLRNAATPGTIDTHTFDIPVEFVVRGNSSANVLTVADIDGDGRPDLLASNQDEATLSILKNTSTVGSIDPNSFAAAVDFASAGENARNLAVADMDGDGMPDIVSVSNADELVSILRNQMNAILPGPPVIASFSPAQGVAGTSVTITGINFDPSPSGNIVFFGATQGSVVSATATQLVVTVNPGATYQPITATVNGLTAYSAASFMPTFSGPGTLDESSFDERVNRPTSSGVTKVAIGDMDLDGKPDIVTSNFADGSVSALLNITPGGYVSFDSELDFNTSFYVPPGTDGQPDYYYNYPISLALADFSGDGKLDVALAMNDNEEAGIFMNSSSVNSIELSNLDGFQTVPYPDEIVVGDFNSDGLPDIITTNTFNDVISVLINNSSGGSTSFQRYADIPSGSHPVGVAVGDLDGDGKSDLAVTNENDNTVSVFLNTTTPSSPVSFAAPVNFASGDLPLGITIGDVDGDGRQDLVVANSEVATISVLQNTTGGSLSFGMHVDFQVGQNPEFIAMGDLDGDGKPDLAVSNYYEGSVSVLKNTSTAGSITSASFADAFTVSVNNNPKGIAIADLDGNGAPEIIVANENDNNVSILPNRSSVATPPPVITITTQPVPADVCVGVMATFSVEANGTTNMHYQWQIYNANSGFFEDVSDASAYTGDNTPHLTIDTSENFGTGEYRCKVSGDLAVDVYSSAVDLMLTSKPAAPLASDGSSCGSSAITVSASGAADGQYRWYTDATGGISVSGEVNGTFTTPLLTSSTAYYVSVIDGICESDRASVLAQVNTVPSVPVTIAGASCGPSATVVVRASGGANGQYRWYAVALGGTAIAGETNDSFTTPLLAASFTYYVAMNNGTCESSRASVLAQINPTPVAPAITQGSSCGPSAKVVVSASGGSSGQYRWYTVASGGTALPGEINANYTTPVLTATTTYFVSINNGDCESNRVAVVASIIACNNPPVIAPVVSETRIDGTDVISLVSLLSDPDNNIDLSTLKILIQPASGARASINAKEELMIDYTGIAFTGKDKLTIQVCDLSGLCTQEEIEIDVTGDIVVYNGISPNGDGRNDFWYIQYIDLIEETKINYVQIFNRWGDMVFETNNYDNKGSVFSGLNKNGNEVSSGTYFFKITFASGRPSRTGYIEVKK